MAKAKYTSSFLLLSISLYIAPVVLYAQVCPDSSSCNAVVGSVAIPSFSTDAQTRLFHAEQPSPDGLFTDNAIGLSYNRSWNNATGFNRDDITPPMTSLGLESYWNGSTELNIDISPPDSTAQLRPFGFTGKYDGSSTLLAIGGGSYMSGAGGVTLVGGTAQSGLVRIQDRTGSSTAENMLAMLRQNQTASFAWRAGGVPRLNFALNPQYDANAFGNDGVLKFAGEWDYGEPLIGFEGIGSEAMLLNSYAEITDTQPRFTLFADGQMNWGSATASADTDLYRSAASTLRTDGSLMVGGDLLVAGSKAAVVQTASYGTREVYAVESPGEWFEDFGDGRLVRGQEIIPIDQVFGQTISTGHDYHVFLTANGPCSLYVMRKQPDAFTVKALRGSRSCRFDYRVVAKRKGYENVRLAKSLDQKMSYIQHR
jgi:hypothetical protein